MPPGFTSLDMEMMMSTKKHISRKLTDKQDSALYTDICDAYERHYQGIPDGDWSEIAGVRHTSTEARAVAMKVMEVLRKWDLVR